MREAEPCVLHLADLKDQEALETLWRTTQAIAPLGVLQVLLTFDDGLRANRTWFAPVAAEVKALRCPGLSIVGKIHALQSEFKRLSREKTLCAVHLHGVGPCLLGSRALKGSALRGRVLYSPHRRHFGSPWTAALLGRLLRRQISAFNYGLLAASLAEAQALSKLLNRSAEVLPQPVSDIFFAAHRQESARPSILAYGSGAGAVDVVTRLSVLLNGRDARVRFSWLGTVAGRARAQLEAAGVHLVGVADDGERTQALSCGTAFLHVSLHDDEPLAVAQAMAVGVPCLVSDMPSHRALIRHGETGFVCTSERDFVETLVLLLRHRTERGRVGEAARAEAGCRFTLRHFERAILRAYGFTRNEARGTATRAGSSAPSPVFLS
jgi:hypothetical protein